jgi:UDP-4-amino-4,6-dideoxy-N-acetyl-beta-L-altrosamine transaminase
VWTSAITFVASANCARLCGADVDFVDIDPATWNMSIADLSDRLARAKRSGRLPKVVIPVHLCGQSCDMAAIAELSSRYGFRIIEDAAHAIGAKYRGAPVGNCHYSDIAVFSFHPVKIITTGEGGVAVTNDCGLAERMNLLRSHGVTRDEAQMTHEADGPWYYQQVALGLNYRMTDIQAALGSSQMRHLDDWVVKRHAIAARYDLALAELPLTLPVNISDSYSAWHLYVILVGDDAPIRRKDLLEKLRSDGIGVNVHYIPVPSQPYYRQRGARPEDFPISASYYSRAISLPMFASLTEAQQNFVVERLTAYCRPG